MRRKNFLTNILNIILQIACIIWILAYGKLYFLYHFNDIVVGTSILIITIIIYMSVAIINLIVGLLNKKESISKMIVYTITSILIFIQPLLIYIANKNVGTLPYIIFIIEHIAIYGLTIALFVLNINTRRIRKIDDIEKPEIKVFIVATSLILFSLILPKISTMSIYGKINKIADKNATMPKYTYAIKENEEVDVIDENGEIVKTISEEVDKGVYYLELKNKKRAYLIAEIDREKGIVNFLDARDVNDMKSVYKAKLVNKKNGYISIWNLAGFSGIEKCWLDDGEKYNEEIRENGFYKTENSEQFSQYEDVQNISQYDYYQNENLVIQIAQKNNNTPNEYYLIKLEENKKIKLECEKLIKGKDTKTQEEYIYFYNKKYIPFIGKTTNGYFDLEGNKTEAKNNYIYIDVSDEIALSAKVNEKDKEKAKLDKNEEGSENTDNQDIYQQKVEEESRNEVELEITDKDKKTLSKPCNGAKILDNFYILTDINESRSLYNLWSKKGKDLTKIRGSMQIINSPNVNKVIITKENEKDSKRTYEFYDENGIVNNMKYKQVSNNIEDIMDTPYPDAYDRYMEILSQMD